MSAALGALGLPATTFPLKIVVVTGFGALAKMAADVIILGRSVGKYGTIINMVIVIVSYHIFWGGTGAEVRVAVSTTCCREGRWRKHPVGPKRDGYRQGDGQSRGENYLDVSCEAKQASGTNSQNGGCGTPGDDDAPRA